MSSNATGPDFHDLLEAYMKPMREFTAKFIAAVNGSGSKYVVPVDSEITYGTPSGPVHSDLDATDRESLHKALDEWLTNSRGTGFFYVGNLVDLANDLQEP
ncbi:hypothetical protein AB0383_20225 [Amycolatopsis sp. NPDC051373]|uniref:hypothetical protein n=1 Tax=Amycolatopsis sp. NPDC051373 TaxID=3155801 RepID=UPI00344E8A6E